MIGPLQQILDSPLASGGSGSDWILATGFWRDVGIWRDDLYWID